MRNEWKPSGRGGSVRRPRWKMLGSEPAKLPETLLGVVAIAESSFSFFKRIISFISWLTKRVKYLERNAVIGRFVENKAENIYIGPNDWTDLKPETGNPEIFPKPRSREQRYRQGVYRLISGVKPSGKHPAPRWRPKDSVCVGLLRKCPLLEARRANG